VEQRIEELVFDFVIMDQRKNTKEQMTKEEEQCTMREEYRRG
jgi:hypothetical protein